MTTIRLFIDFFRELWHTVLYESDPLYLAIEYLLRDIQHKDKDNDTLP